MITLYDYLPSGNGFKVRLLLTFLGIPYRLVQKDIIKGETRTPEFLALNPNGRIPLVVLEDGRRLFESGAIIFYFAEGTRFLPTDRYERAEVLQWMFFEQYSHEPYVAVARFLLIHPEAVPPERLAELPAKQKGGYAALDVMERHLGSGRRWFVGDRLTIADIALYAYTHVAGEGGFDLARYPSIRGWLERVRAEPGYIPITKA
jgi:glutathione S-transferase